VSNLDISNLPNKQKELFNQIEKKFTLNKLKQLGTFKRGRGISNEDLTEIGYPCITYGQLYTRFHGLIMKSVTFINETTMKGSSESTKGDILFPGSGETLEEIGKASVNLLDETLYAGGDIIIFTPNEKIDSLYLSYLLNSKLYQVQIRRLGQGHSVVHIYVKDLENIVVPVPRLEEQIKIASILSTWDRAIELKEQEVKKIRELYRYLIQDLYRQYEGGVAIRDCVIKTTKSLEVKNTYIEISDINIENKTYSITDKIPVKGAKKANKGTILVSKVRPTRGAITILKESSYVSSALSQLSAKKGYLSEFIFYALQTNRFSYMMGSLSTGSTYPTINDDDVLSYKIPDLEINKQKEVVKVLSLIHNRIMLLEKNILHLKLQKKGLMQQLLTGKIRVQV
jgi:type I restriction enzyme S subunit